LRAPTAVPECIGEFDIKAAREARKPETKQLVNAIPPRHSLPELRASKSCTITTRNCQPALLNNLWLSGFAGCFQIKSGIDTMLARVGSLEPRFQLAQAQFDFGAARKARKPETKQMVHLVAAILPGNAA
jgi:nucleoid DNA-binding protein